MTRVGMPAASARARPGAPARFETTTRSAQSSWAAAMRSMIACRLVPVPEMSAPAPTTRSLSAAEGPLPAIGLEHPVLPRGAALEDGALLGVGEDVEVLALDAAHDAACDLLGADDAAHHGGALGDGRLARIL